MQVFYNWSKFSNDIKFHIELWEHQLFWNKIKIFKHQFTERVVTRVTTKFLVFYPIPRVLAKFGVTLNLE